MSTNTNDELYIEYIGLDELKNWNRNPKKHDLGALVLSIRRYGFRDAVILDDTIGEIIVGNGRVEALKWLKKNNETPPIGIKVDKGEWFVPVQKGISASSMAEAEAFGIDHNNLTMMGGDFDMLDYSRMWDDSYPDVLLAIARDGGVMVSNDAESIESLFRLRERQESGAPEDVAVEKQKPLKIYCDKAYLDDVVKAIKALVVQHPEWRLKIT